MEFVHLHTHSHYSLLDGLAKISDMVDYAKKLGFKSLALTDHGTMYGSIEFYQRCKKAGIKPIIGVEGYMASKSRLNKISKSDERNYHILLLAKNETGYKNLLKLVSIAHLEGYYYKPRIDWEVLTQYHEGLICSTACLAGEIPRLVLANKMDRARMRIQEFRELFGEGNFYLEIMPHFHIPEQVQVNKAIIELSRETGVPMIATNDIHYLRKEDHDVQDVLLCLQTKNKKDDIERMMMDGESYYMRSAEEMAECFKDVPQAISNTVKVAEKCNLEIELGKIRLPYFEVPEGYDGDTYLRQICEEGLKKRYGKAYDEVDEKIRERLDYELGVIGNMGWPSYFLIVADFVTWAKENGIVVGPGRGSAAGSLVCYLTGITNLDPLQYDLLFERFLNPDRISMPDIDMDFSDVRRDDVIRYVERKYGKDHVSQIITFGTMAARAAIRDVGRVLNYPYDYCDKLAKMIPMFSKIEEALENVNELREIYDKEEQARTILDYARRLEGVARHASTHACGVVITAEPLTENVPLQYASSSDKSIITQYSLHPVEDLGILKMDFLGLKNLTIIESAIKIIKNTRGLELDIDLIPLDDKKTYRLFQEGETTGVFQFESSGMKRYLRELKPTEFEDIIAMVALYRPGPMEWIPDYIAGKHGHKRPAYLHPKLEPILKKTYGVAIYQEQVMQMARDLAGFTMAQADVLRKAVGKKILKLLNEQKEKFIDGCVKNGISSQLAEKIFSFIEPFAGYGFNRSHAACYALIGYQTAYLKAHWPTEFMAALLTADQQNTDRVAIEIEECRRMDIEVMPPDVNQSFGSFTVVTTGTETNELATSKDKFDTIRFGLKAIKNIGEHIADEMIRERKENGPYEDISNLLERVGDKDMNKKSLEALIKSGALDKYGERGLLLHNMDNMLAFHKEVHRDKLNGQSSLFADAPDVGLAHKVKLAQAAPAARQEKLGWEKELLGLYITEHPFGDFQKHLDEYIIPLVKLGEFGANSTVAIAGVISKIQKIVTRSNESMLFVKIEDTLANVELLVFPRLLKENPAIWEEGKVVMCVGKLSDKDRETKVLCNKAMSLDLDTIEVVVKRIKSWLGKANGGYNGGYASRKVNKDLVITFRGQIDKAKIESIKSLLGQNKGNDRVIFNIVDNGSSRSIETEVKVKNEPELRQIITDILGNSGNVA